MRPLTPDLDRDIDLLATTWLELLEDWRPEDSGGGRGICLPCLAYADELQLDELPHDALHPLVAGIEALLAQCVTVGEDAPLGDLAVAEAIRRRAIRRVLARHATIAAVVAASIEPRIQRLAERLAEETCER